MTYRIAYCGWQATAIRKPQVMMDFGNVFFRRCLALRKRARLWVYVCKKWCLCCRITLLATQALLDLKVYACSCFSFPKQTHTHTKAERIHEKHTKLINPCWECCMLHVDGVVAAAVVNLTIVWQLVLVVPGVPRKHPILHESTHPKVLFVERERFPCHCSSVHRIHCCEAWSVSLHPWIRLLLRW